MLTQFSKSKCEKGNIRIEVASSSNNIFSVFGILSKNINPLEIPNWAGYYMWRDSINSEGGICVGGDTNALVNNECKGGKRYLNFHFLFL